MDSSVSYPYCCETAPNIWGPAQVLESVHASPRSSRLPLVCLGKKGNRLGLSPQQVFQGAKHIIKHSEPLHALDPARSCELGVHVTQKGFGWGLWQ